MKETPEKPASFARRQVKRIVTGQALDLSCLSLQETNRVGSLKREENTGLSTISTDISEERQAEEVLKECQQRCKELQTLLIRLAELHEAERQRLARELHDKMGQNLTALGFNLNFIQTQLPASMPNKDICQAYLAKSLALAEETIDDLRQVIAELYPPMLNDYGLIEALDWYTARFAASTGIPIKIRGGVLSPRPAARVENALFRIVQEALLNVSKHSKATQVIVTVFAKKQLVRLIVSDNGVGFETGQITQSKDRLNLGLINMRERAKAVGGHCQVESKPGQGTRVIVEVPR